MKHGHSKALKKRLMRRHGGCQACGGGQLGGGRHAPVLEIHHYVPRHMGGADTEDNAVLVCRPCHAAIHNGEIVSPEPSGAHARQEKREEK